jgi:hypothetical protein
MNESTCNGTKTNQKGTTASRFFENDEQNLPAQASEQGNSSWLGSWLCCQQTR